VKVQASALWAAAGSGVSAVAASACCWLPLFLLGFGASAAGASAAFEQVRPFFLAVAAILLGVGFYLTYFRKEACAPGAECAPPNPKLRRFNRAMLWIAMAVVFAAALFPNYVGLLLANTDQAVVADESLSSVTLKIEGMTCEVCATQVQEELAKVPGVKQASVHYADGKALLTFDSSSPPSENALLEAVHRAGYRAKLVDRSGKRVTLYVEGMTKVQDIT
jgi:copper chaperone CopZ